MRDGAPPYLLTMIGPKRLSHLRCCVETVISERVPGNPIECGVWRGGAFIMMRGALKTYGKTERVVWVADFFRALPPNPERYPADAGATWHERETSPSPYGRLGRTSRTSGS